MGRIASWTGRLLDGIPAPLHRLRDPAMEILEAREGARSILERLRAETAREADRLRQLDMRHQGLETERNRWMLRAKKGLDRGRAALAAEATSRVRLLEARIADLEAEAETIRGTLEHLRERLRETSRSWTDALGASRDRLVCERSRRARRRADRLGRMLTRDLDRLRTGG